MKEAGRGLTGKDVITAGMFPAIYFVTRQFTAACLITFVISCGLAELARYGNRCKRFRGNAAAFTLFSLEMAGSPPPIWSMDIRDAMKPRNIHGLKKIECLAVPLMVSATGTAEELSAAAVTRGIETPASYSCICRQWT